MEDLNEKLQAKIKEQMEVDKIKRSIQKQQALDSSLIMDLELKCWCFTLNNYTERDIEMFRKLVEDKKTKYLVFGYEVGESGTPHLQGYVEFFNKIRPMAKRGMIRKDYFKHGNINWRARSGTAENAAHYCMKDEHYEEYGSITTQGARTDFKRMFKRVKEGVSDLDLIDEFGQIAFNSLGAIAKVRLMSQPKRKWKMLNYIYYGEPETGKSRKVFDDFDTQDVFVKPPGKWFDGYEGQPVVLIDDFDPKNPELTFDFMLKLFDRYPMSVEIKGGMVNFSSKIIIITTNHDPSEWFQDKTNRWAFYRRITAIVPFDRNGYPPVISHVDRKLKDRVVFRPNGSVPLFHPYDLDFVDAKEEFNRIKLDKKSSGEGASGKAEVPEKGTRFRASASPKIPIPPDSEDEVPDLEFDPDSYLNHMMESDDFLDLDKSDYPKVWKTGKRKNLRK